jgi:hypothetical protein
MIDKPKLDEAIGRALYIFRIIVAVAAVLFAKMWADGSLMAKKVNDDSEYKALPSCAHYYDLRPFGDAHLHIKP